MVYFDSKAIRRAEYDADARVLYLWFRESSGPYGYRDVPEDVFDSLCAAESQGRFYREQILDRYEYSPPADRS
ncbi:KTSC domain-containing protein [Devosia lacusdianchii]|uniref:KTSC domain-containing protein n=1 Tax=Devosia lacusdianchii TaxID=2917991 RepID=UPI001F0534F0|nr:KTSC domain-containing protein [Devosia sp. JXJ CY 41]